MKKYFDLLGSLSAKSLNRLVSKFIVLFIIIPSLIFPQFAWAATADVDRMVANPLRGVPSVGPAAIDLPEATTDEDAVPIQPSCLERWSLRVSRWWYGAPQTPFTPAPHASVEMVSATVGTRHTPAAASKRASVYRADDADAKGGALPELTETGARSLDAFRAREEKGEVRASFAPHNANPILNPLALAKHALHDASAAGTGAIIIPAGDRASPPSDHESTSAGSTGSDSPPQAGVAKNPLHAAALREDAWSDEGEADIEKGEPVARALATTVAEPIDPKMVSALKVFNQYMLTALNPQTSKRNLIKWIVTGVITGLLAIELWGEGKMMIDRTLTALLVSSKDNLNYLMFTQEGLGYKMRVSNFLLINAAIALAPYLPFRLGKAIDILTPEPEKRATEKKIPTVFKRLGDLTTILIAGVQGALPAYASYQSNYLFDKSKQEYARVVPPFIFLFYTIDTFVRLQALRTRIFNKIFVNRGSTVVNDRLGIVNALKEAKRAIFTMSDKALLEFYSKLTDYNRKVQDPSSNSGLEQYKLLTSLKMARAHSPNLTKRSWTYLARQYGPTLAAALLAIAGGYISARLAYTEFGETYKYLTTGTPSTTVYDQIALNNAELYKDDKVANGRYLEWLWNNGTTGVTVYDGNGTDWCWQCFGSGKYILGSQEEPDYVPITFPSCPGISPTRQYFADLTNGETDYSDYNCVGWFDWWAARSSNYDPTGITYYNEYLTTFAPYLLNRNGTSEDVSPAGKALSGIGSALAAVGTYGLGFIASSAFVKRCIDSFRQHPEEVMPGKKVSSMKIINVSTVSVEMLLSLFESLIRAAPVIINGWMLLKADSMGAGAMWVTLGIATLTSAATFFPDFDETYGRVPSILQRSWQGMLTGVNKLLGREVRETQNVLSIRDKLIIDIDQIIGSVLKADDDIIKALKTA